MSIENNTVNRGYPLPHEDNKTAVDVLRLIEALTDIDVDMATALTGLVAKAPLASPTFSGDPTAPTPVVGDDTNKLATTAFVRRAVSDLVNSSPAALDTLNELATALGNDANFAATMAAALAGKQPSNATLTAIASLAPVADKLLYLNGSAAVALATLSAFSRTLLDDADAATFYATLGVIPNGQLPDRLKSNVTILLSNADDAINSGDGWFAVDAATTNLPEGGLGIITHAQTSANTAIQTYRRTSNANMWIRTRSGGVWGPWSRIYGTQSVLGSVSQVAGVPTGGLIERGSNANGDYVKFADGTMITWTTVDETATAWTTAAGALFTRSTFLTVNLPASFNANPTVVASANFLGTPPICGVGVRNLATNAVNLIPWAYAGIAGGMGKALQIIAIGRWF